MKERLSDGCYRRIPSTPDDGDVRELIIEDAITDTTPSNAGGIGARRRKSRQRTPLMDRRWR